MTCCLQALLVGGFCCSPYLQQRLRQALVGGGLVGEVEVPPHPQAAVMKGVYANWVEQL